MKVEDKVFNLQAKAIVDKLFVSGFFKDTVTRDDMNHTERYISQSMALQLKSELIYIKLKQ